MKMFLHGLKKTSKFFLIFLFCTGVSARELTLFFINAHNLFDTVHDPGKQDYTFLPKSSPLKKKCKDIPKKYQRTCFAKNWTEKKLTKKIEALCEVIHASKAEIIGLVEVENRKVLKRLAKQCGYQQYFITNGPDRRGIDQALLAKKKIKINATEIPVARARSLLKAEISINNKTFDLYLTHWPSQRSPTSRRLEVAKSIAKKINGKRTWVMMGDFNIVESEETELKKVFPFQNLISETTYFYPVAMKWNAFDRIYLDQRFTDQFEIKKSGVFKARFLQNVYEYDDPKNPFYGSRVTGVPDKKYSDHFPVFLTLKFD